MTARALRSREEIRACMAALLLATALGGCSLVPADTPTNAVHRALDAVVAHDLVTASLSVCSERRNVRDFPFPIGGIFEPVGALPGFDIPRTLGVIGLDASGLSIVEKTRAGDAAEVEVAGILIERFESNDVEALFRAYAAESGQPIDEILLNETLAKVSNGDVQLMVREVIRVIREAGVWKVCVPAPTP